jgi:hypothetical protein
MKLGSVADYPLESQSMPLKTETITSAIRVGHIQMREFRTVDASKMLKAIAEDNVVFTHVKNEVAFDGVNPGQDARIPRSPREPETCVQFDSDSLHF